MRRVLFVSFVVVLAGSPVSAQTLSFTDVTEQAGVLVTHAIPEDVPFPARDFMGGGAVGDFNRDGWLDFLYLSGGVEPDRLFINDGDGTFTDQASEWGIDATHAGGGAAVGDVNNDEWPDLYVTGLGDANGQGYVPGGYHRLYINNGDGTFTDTADQAGVRHIASDEPDGWQPSLGDVDLDGDLDIFVGGYNIGKKPQRLFLNNGDGTFVDATEGSGLADWEVATFLSGFSDVNGDRLPDLLWVGDFGTSRFLMNVGDATFDDRTEDALGISTANGMGLAVGDVSNDGWLDAYVTSITWPPQNFGGNVLLHNNADGSFDSVAAQVGVKLGGWGWGCAMADFDHNGWTDIVETNGFASMGAGFAVHQSYLYLNMGYPEFVEAAIETGLEHYGQGRGLVTFDYDNDGDRDVIIFTNEQELSLFRNDLEGPDAHWLRVALDTSKRDVLAPDGYGSFLVARTASGVQLVRAIDGHPTHLSQGELAAHFGLASDAVLDWLRVEWSDGTFTTLESVSADQRLTITAPTHPADFDGDDAVTGEDLSAFIDALQAQSMTADFDGNAQVNVFDAVAFFVSWRDAS